jgi:hypothetical protein
VGFLSRASLIAAYAVVEAEKRYYHFGSEVRVHRREKLSLNVSLLQLPLAVHWSLIDYLASLSCVSDRRNKHFIQSAD